MKPATIGGVIALDRGIAGEKRAKVGMFVSLGRGKAGESGLIRPFLRFAALARLIITPLGMFVSLGRGKAGESCFEIDNVKMAIRSKCPNFSQNHGTTDRIGISRNLYRREAHFCSSLPKPREQSWSPNS